MDTEKRFIRRHNFAHIFISLAYIFHHFFINRPNILKVVDWFANIPVNYPLCLSRPIHRVIAFIDINVDT